MRKLAITIAALAIILVISGCDTKKDTGVSFSNPFIGGTSSLVLDFEESAPPAEVTDDGSYEFNAIFMIKNEGEYEVPKDRVKISLEGFLPSDFGANQQELTNLHPDEDLLSKRRDGDGNTIEGTTAFVYIPTGDGSFVPRKLTGNNEFTFRANVCYNYQTRASAKLCVLKDLINVDNDALCDPNGARTVYSSSSPLRVSNFRQSSTGRDKMTFNFDIVHSGNGNIFQEEQNFDSACPRDASTIRKNEDKVKVDVRAEGISGLNCQLQTDNIVRLVNGRKTVTCNLDLTGQHDTDFEKIIDITLAFDYQDFKETSVLVRHILE